MRIERVALRATTTGGTVVYETDLGPGLNVLAAPNSFGKSTVLQAIIYGLGLEGMLSASHALPVGPAMTTVVDLPGGVREQVVESYVELDLANDSDATFRVRRHVVSLELDTSLVQTWTAQPSQSLDDASRVDLFVRQPGAAVNALGFHRALTEFLGWQLPLVPTYADADVPLYLEALFPLFYVEQKAGWAGLAPKMPTYLRIRDVLQRSIEYVLGLSTLDRLKAREELKREQDRIRKDWAAVLSSLSAVASTNGFQVTEIGTSPTMPSALPAIHATGLQGSDWVPLRELVWTWQTDLRRLSGQEIETTGERATESRSQLAEAERSLAESAARLRAAQEQMSLLRSDVSALNERISHVVDDRRKLQDVSRLQRLGSDLDLDVLEHGACPTCLQPLDAESVPHGGTASIDDTLRLVDAERTTLERMRAVAEQKQHDVERVVSALSVELDGQRRRVRLLRDELVQASNTPSMVDVERRLTLSRRIEAGKFVMSRCESANELLEGLSEEWEGVQQRLAALDGTYSRSDLERLRAFRDSFSDQLRQYGLRSLPVDSVTIDSDTFVPVNDGVELSFDLGLGMSASDSIRTKWAYFVSLLEAAAQFENTHHSRFLMFDEPRQQEAAREDLGQFIRRLADAGRAGTQVIYATSETAEELSRLLADVPHTRLAAEGPHLLRRSDTSR